MPKISIILPTYNTEKYIARALDSCINQTLKDIEVIVVDDKGQDRSIQIARDYASRDSRIKIIDNIENKGTFEARNIGVKNANSELIMFLDPDDELELNACEVVFETMRDEKIDMSCYGAIKKTNNFEKIFIQFNSQKFTISEYKRQFYKYDWCLWNKAYRKSFYIKAIDLIAASSRLVIAEDLLINYALVNIYKNDIFLSPSIIYKYHDNDGSITKTVDFNRYLLVEKSYQDVINIIKDLSVINSFDILLTQYLINKVMHGFYTYSREFYKDKNIFNYIKYRLLSRKSKINIRKFTKKLTAKEI